MKKCHVCRFVRVFRGRMILSRKVSLFFESSRGKRLFSTGKNEGFALVKNGNSEVVEKSVLISSL
ncbi:MAG: hypothetical protein AABW79_02150 [Nanoarchaeota archaeon]